MIWLDAHLSPRLASWIKENLYMESAPLRDLGLRDADDNEIFEEGRLKGVVILTKDSDFAEMVLRKGSPPSVIWLRCGNTSEENLKLILGRHLKTAMGLILDGEKLVEIR